MFEFEIIWKNTNIHAFLYGYNEKDLAKRYPQYSPETYEIVYKEYID